MIGLGQLGGNMAERLGRASRTIVDFDQSPDSGREAEPAAASSADAYPTS